MEEIIHASITALPREHAQDHPKYEYYRRELVPWERAGRCNVAMYEVPPGKAAYPYHYHVMDEEVFYILSGEGLLRTPSGERPVKAGEFIFFPANENGAHQLTNVSQLGMLVYLDFGTRSELEVAFYPDSGKLGVWGKDIDRVYKTADSVDYYEGE